MAQFKHHPSDGHKGKISYNSGIVSSIVQLAVVEVEGVALPDKKRWLKLYFEKEGVVADISVSVDYGHNVPDVAFKIQQTVKHNVEVMTEFKVAKVDVHVVSVEFSEEQHFAE